MFNVQEFKVILRPRSSRSNRSKPRGSGVQAFSITFGFATNKVIPDDYPAEGTIYILINAPRTPQTYPKLPCSPPIECEKALQRGYSGSTHEEIVISRAFTKAVFPGTIEGAGSSRSKPHGSSKFKGSTFNDHTPSDSSSVSGILETSK